MRARSDTGWCWARGRKRLDEVNSDRQGKETAPDGHGEGRSEKELYGGAAGQA